jgi:hypothetical protein
MRTCQCGCGKTTKNRFAPGHDAKLKGQLLRLARFGNDAERAAATRELESLGWAHFLTGRRVETSAQITARRFGVELEIQHSSRYEMAQALRDAGIAAVAEGYNHETRNHWKLVTDASVRGGYEVVSPVLEGEAGLAALRTVCAVLKAQGAKVNKSCGLHIHHDISDLGVADVSRVVEIYATAQNSIDGILAPSRRTSAHNTYCAPFSSYELDIIRNAATITDISSRLSRYRVLNLCSYPKYGTLEFRQHQGSIDFDKIQSWLIFGQQMIERGREGLAPSTSIEPIVCNAALAAYFRTRAASLAA